MKKIFLIILIFCSFYIVNASFKTYKRTKNNLLVSSDVVVNEDNINAILKTPAVDASNKIYDFAVLLTEEEEKQIYLKIKDYIKNTGIDAVIITTSNLDTFSINDYAYNFYDYNDFVESGVVFVIYKDSSGASVFMGNNGPRDSHIFTLYTNARINEILKYVYENDVRSGNYYQACDSFIKLIDGFYIKTYGITNDNSIDWVMVSITASCLTIIIVVLAIVFLNNREYLVKNIVENGLKREEITVKCLYDNPIK